MRQAAAEREHGFSRIAGAAVLRYRVRHVLTVERVFQFRGEQRQPFKNSTRSRLWSVFSLYRTCRMTVNWFAWYSASVSGLKTFRA